ncbi:SigB/SigF/SigG family RNA polymerase sigma factor [Peptoniphilus lacrimalis]|uniref:SigB/SigF/SigG family RNA polymerase sigma factor n=1 Tax=Peptoniphilus lacrimalis TaxID=33031 RepID=UPI00050F1972|nr:SigB/SigF/SigG family RNA polymerase sigma factor [Peptoniphilus lacrimalis]KGF36806.1 RNA polymerase sigma 70 [Peptoniphilus lacrimalis DNF00528]MDK7721885.1 SigB/SigF/SigG family RNA polymerase sigma factor [Peptoniphilus lacrimalis]MDK7731487.1 SigB/SigF/SigG family RNA polymerase sigma factor [Peptoniphilus lacrimalis]
MNIKEYKELDRKLTKEEKKELFLEYYKTKDQDLRTILIEEYLYIAEILSKKYIGKGIDYDDIYQVASIGLIYSVDRFDPTKGYEFSSFATPTIIGEIKKYFRDKGWTIRVPRRIQELSKKIMIAKNKLSQEYQRTPTVEDIAEFLNASPEEIIESMEASKVYTPQSLDIVYDSGDDKKMSLQDLIGEDEKYFDKIDLKDFLLKSMKNLNEVEKTILIDRYFNKKTQIVIAKKLNISQMTVSRIEKKVLEKMRKEIKKTMEV